MKQLEQVYNDVAFLQKVAKSSREFVVMLRSPVIHADKKIKIISAIAGSNTSLITYAFISLLCRKNMEGKLIDASNEYMHRIR